MLENHLKVQLTICTPEISFERKGSLEKHDTPNSTAQHNENYVLFRKIEFL